MSTLSERLFKAIKDIETPPEAVETLLQELLQKQNTKTESADADTDAPEEVWGDINAVQESTMCGTTLLHAAAATSGRAPIVSMLIKRGVNVGITDNFGCTPLAVACSINNSEVARTLICEGGASVSAAANNLHEPPLLVAARNDSEETSLLLIELGASINATARFTPQGNEDSALHWAAKNGSTELVSLRVARGADVNVHGGFMFTPLHHAAAHDHHEIATILIQNGATIDAPDQNGMSPLHTAVVMGEFPEMVQVLLDAGADPRDKCASDTVVLMAAVD